MVFEHIERLKSEYTDKYVVVDGSRPELRRFQGQTGYVKTVNMNGRALVQFDANLNTGWIDIELDYLKVVDKPAPIEPAEKAPPKASPAPKSKSKAKAAPKSATSDLSASDILAAARGGGKKAPAAPKPAKSDMSVDDIMAAARGTKSSDETATESAPSAKAKSAGTEAKGMSVDDILAAARTGKSAAAEAPAKPKSPQETKPSAAPAAKVSKDMSVEDILAAARAKQVQPTSTPASSAPSDGGGDQPPKEETPPKSADKPASLAGTLPTEPADIVAWCRERDQ